MHRVNHESNRILVDFSVPFLICNKHRVNGSLLVLFLFVCGHVFVTSLEYHSWWLNSFHYPSCVCVLRSSWFLISSSLSLSLWIVLFFQLQIWIIRWFLFLILLVFGFVVFLHTFFELPFVELMRTINVAIYNHWQLSLPTPFLLLLLLLLPPSISLSLSRLSVHRISPLSCVSKPFQEKHKWINKRWNQRRCFVRAINRSTDSSIRWKGGRGKEKKNFQLFFSTLFNHQLIFGTSLHRFEWLKIIARAGNRTGELCIAKLFQFFHVSSFIWNGICQREKW